MVLVTLSALQSDIFASAGRSPYARAIAPTTGTAYVGLSVLSTPATAGGDLPSVKLRNLTTFASVSAQLDRAARPSVQLELAVTAGQVLELSTSDTSLDVSVWLSRATGLVSSTAVTLGTNSPQAMFKPSVSPPASGDPSDMTVGVPRSYGLQVTDDLAPSDPTELRTTIEQRRVGLGVWQAVAVLYGAGNLTFDFTPTVADDYELRAITTNLTTQFSTTSDVSATVTVAGESIPPAPPTFPIDLANGPVSAPGGVVDVAVSVLNAGGWYWSIVSSAQDDPALGHIVRTPPVLIVGDAEQALAGQVTVADGEFVAVMLQSATNVFSTSLEVSTPTPPAMSWSPGIAPTAATASVGDYQSFTATLNGATGNLVELGWNSSGDPASGFEGLVNAWPVISADPSAFNWGDALPNEAAGTTRHYAFRADADGSWVWSDFSAVTIEPAPPTPSGAAGSPGEGTTITWSWQAVAEATSYVFRFRRAGSADPWIEGAGAATSVTINHAAHDSYEFQAASHDGAATSPWSTLAFAQTETADPVTPTVEPTV